MEAQGQRNSADFEKKMNKLKEEFFKNVDMNSIRNIKNLTGQLKGIIKEELAQGNIHNAMQLKENLTKHVSLEETNKMMLNLNKLYKQ